MTLNATTPGNEVVLDTSTVTAENGIFYIKTKNDVTIPRGTTISVKFRIPYTDAFKAVTSRSMLRVYLSSNSTDDNAPGNGSWEDVYFTDFSDEVYTLTVNFLNDYSGPLYLCMQAPELYTNLLNYEENFAKYSFGSIWQGVTFFDADGFLFGDGTSLDDQWNGYFSATHTLPSLKTIYTGGTVTYNPSPQQVQAMHYNLVSSTSDISALAKTLTYLQRCIDDLRDDNALRVHVTANLSQTNKDDGVARALITPENVFLGANDAIDAASLDGSQWPLNIASGNGNATISFDTFDTTDNSYTSDNHKVFLPKTSLQMLICKDENVTWEDIENSNGDIDEKYTYYVNSYSTITNSATYELKSENVSPTLTITAPAGTYKSGDLVPITITGDEYIKASADATVTINNTPYQLSDLHSSTDGKFISFLYEVKEIDSATLTVQSVTGITDFFGNDAKEVSGAPISGVELATPQMKNAVERLGVTYTDGALHFTIAAKQDEAYQNFYANNKDALMQLLITVDDGAPVTHAVTVGEDTVNNGFTFTADPYTIAPTTQEQTVTVQLQVNTGTAGTPSWVTVNRVTQTVTVDALLDVTGVTATVVDGAGQIVQPGTDDKYTVAMDEMEGKTYKLQAAFTPADATYQTGTWHSSDATIATVSNGGEGNPEAGTIQFQSQTGEVEFWFVADNGTEATEDDKESPHLTFVVTAGNSLILSIPPYAQDSLIQADKDATVSWVTNVFDFYPDADVTFTVGLFAGTETTGTPIETYTVENLATTPEKITECTIPAADLPVTYPQSQYTVQVSMTSPEARSDDTGITVLSPPTEMRITADKTSITDGKTLELNYSINNASATGTLSATRMAGGKTEENADGCLSTTSNLQNNGTVTFDPVEVDGDNLYDTYTITFTEDTQTAGANIAPSTDSLVLYVYKRDALSIQSNGQDVESISLNNASEVDGAGKLPTESDDIMALRQELGLIAYVSINADAHNWSSFRDGIQWALSGDAENVAINYRQGGLWDNIEDLSYETYLPQTQMAISATADVQGVTVTATHAATGMSDTVTVDVETLQDKLYMFQATPAQVTTVTYTTGKGEARTLTTNVDGLLVVYEPDSIASDVQFRSGDDSNPNLGTIAQEALSSGERDAAKLQLYPLNAITLVPAAKAELYLVQPDGTPFANQTVTLRGGVYLEDNYCGEDVRMGPDSNSLVPGNRDGTYTTDGEGKLTVHMDATQFNADGYTGPLTNAALDYWFELRDLNGNQYYPVLVNVQGSMSADRILRTGSAVVVLEEVPDGEENKPYLTAQTLSYGEEDGSGELQVRNVLDSTGKVGPNSTYKYAELTSYFTLWGVDNDKGGVTVSMTGENGYAPEGQVVKDDTFPFASIPILTNTTVLTKATMTDSGWLEPETAESLRASVYQNGELVKQGTMPFQVIDLTEVEPVNVDATAVMVDMSARFAEGIGNGGSNFSFTAGGSNSVTRAFNGNIEDMLGDIQEVTNPLFRVLITPSEDNSVFNVLIWGGYNSLNLQDFDYTQDGFSMDYQLMEPQLDFGVPSVNEIGEMAAGTYDPADTLTLNAMGGTHNNLDFGAQLEGYYEGQFYYDTDQRAWCFRAINGGFTAGAGVSFQANVNAWVGPIPITGSFGAGIALQLDYKAATVYTDQQDAATLATWTDAAQQSDSVNDYLTTLRINGYIDAFGGFGFDYTIIALKIGLFGRLAGDSTNRFLSRTYLENEDDAQMDGQALGINGEVGIKFVAKFLFISYETVLGSGSIGYSHTFNDWSTIDTYWGGASGGSLQRGAPTLLSRSYLEAYANGATRWNSGAAQFGGTATVVQEDANPGSEPAVNDDGSLSVYISDENSDSYFDSRIRAGAVGAEGKIIDDDTDNENNGHGDMSPSLSGDSGFTVAAWIRLFEDLEDDKKEGEALTAAEQKQLLNSTEIMVATTGDNGGNWKVQQLTENASPDLAPVTASNGTSAVVFWRSAYASDPENLLNFDTQNAIYYSRYNGSMWSEPKMAYNGSIGSVVGLQASMLSDGTALAAFTVDRTPDNTVSTDYEMAYRVIGADDALGDLVVLTRPGQSVPCR